MEPETDRRKAGVYRHRVVEKRDEPLSVGAAIGQALDGLGLSHKLKEQRVLSQWPHVVGKQIAGVTRVDAIRRGELLVSVAHDAWRHRLLFERETIRQKLNQAVGGDVVRLIRFTK